MFQPASNLLNAPRLGPQQPPGGGGLFGGGASTGGGGGGLFGGSSTAGGGGLFGGGSSGAPGGGLFGGGGSTAPGGGGMFGGGNTTRSAFGGQPQQQSMFGGGGGGSGSAGGGLFGSQPQQNFPSMFGAPPAQQPSLFGGGVGAGGNTNTGLFGSAPAPSLFAGPGFQSPSPSGSNFGFRSAMDLIPFFDAPELVLGTLPDRKGQQQQQPEQQQQQPQQLALQQQQQQNMAQKYLVAGLIPEILKNELVEQQIEIDRCDRLLHEAMTETSHDFAPLLNRTSAMEASIQSLRDTLDDQRRSVEILVRDCRNISRETERAVQEARRMSARNQKLSLDKPMPSDFFWALLDRLETRLKEYDNLSTEVKSLVSMKSKNQNPSQGIEDVIEIISQQFRTFELIAEGVARVHEEADSLRDKFSKWHVAVKGIEPSEDLFQNKAEMERRRRLMRKIEEKASMPSVQPSSTPQMLGGQQLQQPLQLQQQQPATSQFGGLFGGGQQQQPGSSLWGGGGGGTGMAPPMTSSGLFGGNMTTSTLPTGLTAAPNAPLPVGAGTPVVSQTASLLGWGAASQGPSGGGGSAAPTNTPLFGSTNQGQPTAQDPGPYALDRMQSFAAPGALDRTQTTSFRNVKRSQGRR